MKYPTLKQLYSSLPKQTVRITTLTFTTALLVVVLTIVSTRLFTPANSQNRPRTVDRGTTVTNDRTPAEVVKVDVDLVTVDALVLQKDTARVVGDLKQEDFILSEDGVKQRITHFSQDSLPLSVLLLIDRGGCLDPFGTTVRTAALDAIAHLKPTDEVAVMSYHNHVELLQEVPRDPVSIADALNHVPSHDEDANHCLNRAFAEAADYVQKAGNPMGRRVIVAITGVTRNFDCAGGPSGKSAARAVYESGAVVCGIIPKT